ncbi:MAG: DNA topoisomerase IV subunit A [Sphingomonadales bacterium]|jgi:topoisomerase-4 subunit A
MTAPVHGDTIIDVPFSDALSERYLAYALSTIMSRSLPDVRDGLKPVHRRLLYAMRLLKLDPSSGYKKCARVVGDVIGKYHPHGDQAVYDALVRLAQDFSVRYPLIDGQGNFGNIDGDNAAAMRYTEARMTSIAKALMDGLDEDAVDFRKTYDGEEEEPVVFPGAFPNLLANGAAGIAVGMATSIPPHNVSELVDALVLLLARPEASDDAVFAMIPGPDFPTGGIIVEPKENIAEAYRTGRGSIRLRARWSREDTGRGTYQIVVSEIPYQVQKSRLIEKIAELINDKKLPMLSDVRDESSEDLRIVLEPRSKNIDAEVLMEGLFKITDLETRFSLNLNVLDKSRTPGVMSLKEALVAFLDHQIEVLVRRSNHRLSKIEHRLEILGGYLIAYLNLDEVIRIIREEDEPKAELMKSFSLSEVQAEAILNMRLRSLRKLEEMEIRKEDKALRAERTKLKTLLGDEAMQRDHVSEQLKALKDDYGKGTELGRRRSEFADAPEIEVVPLEAMIEKEPVTVVLSEKGWIRALKGHVDADNGNLKYKEGDGPGFSVQAYTTDKLLVFTSDGRFYTLGADKLPGGRGHGEPLRLMLDLSPGIEIMSLLVFKPGSKVLVSSTSGRGFVAEAAKLIASTRSGKQVMNVSGKDRALKAIEVEGDHVATVGKNRKMLIFPVSEVTELSRGQGVILQRLKDSALVDVVTLNLEEGLSWPMGGESGRMRTQNDLTPWIGKRSQAGKLPPVGFPRSGLFSG